MIKCVIFDFGDTLVQSSVAAEKTHKNRPELQILKKLGYDFSNKKLNNATLRMIEKTKNLSSKVKQEDKTIFARTLLQELGIKPTKKLAIECENAYYAKLRENIKLMPNTVKLLEFLKKKKIIACVISNTRIDSNLKIAKNLKIRKYFRHFIMSHLFGSVKSELKIFRHALEEINKNRKNKIKPEECLMVGDNAEEDGAAKLTGMKTAILTKFLRKKEHLQRLKPDYLINDLKEIEKIVNFEGF